MRANKTQQPRSSNKIAQWERGWTILLLRLFVIDPGAGAAQSEKSDMLFHSAQYWFLIELGHRLRPFQKDRSMGARLDNFAAWGEGGPLAAGDKFDPTLAWGGAAGDWRNHIYIYIYIYKLADQRGRQHRESQSGEHQYTLSNGGRKQATNLEHTNASVGPRKHRRRCKGCA